MPEKEPTGYMTETNPNNYLRNFKKVPDGLIFKTTIDNAKFKLKEFKT